MNTHGRMLRISLALNVVLIGISAFAFLGGSANPLHLFERASKGSSDVALLAESDLPGAELARLRQLGLTDEETMPIILERIRQKISDRIPTGSDSYWKSDWQSVSRESVSARSRQTEAIRAAVISMYGPQAETAIPLKDLFRPLEATLPFLSPAEQRAVVQYRMSRSVRAGPATPPVGTGLTPAPMPAFAAGSRQRAATSHADFLASLPAELSDANKFEISLRESPIAARLRAANADLTEPEFRALFVAIADAEAKHLPLSMDIAAGQVARSKVLKIVSQGDPAWIGLQAVAPRLALSEQQVSAVYEAVRQANTELAALAAEAAGGAARSPAQISGIMQERHRRIQQIVGAESAQTLLDALNESYRSFALRTPQAGAAGTLGQ